jgi:hypothetical protein
MFSTSCVPSWRAVSKPKVGTPCGSGQREVVVDGLRHVADRDPAAGLLLDARGRVGRIVAADGHEIADPELGQRLDHVGHLFRAFGGIFARRA